MRKNSSRMDRMEQHLNDLTSFQQELRAEMKALSLGVLKEISEMKQKIDEILWKFDETGKHFSGGKDSINTQGQGWPTVRNEVVKKEIDEMTGKFDELGKHFLDNQSTDSNTTTTTSSTSQGSPGVMNELLQYTVSVPELDFPRFNGDNPRSWIRKCEKYFMLIPMADFDKVVLASFHMEDKAEIWYTAYVEGREDVGWNRFAEMVLERFSEPGEENLTGAFNKLRQDGSVEGYIARFLELKAFMVQMHGTLTEEFFMQSFMGGLKVDLRYMVEMMNPSTLPQAIQFARVQESCLLAAMSKEQEEDYACYSITRKGLSGSSSCKNLPVRRLTCEEIENRRRRGLCFNCDGVYFTEHKCKKLFVIMGKKEVEVSDGTESEVDNDEDYQISVHASISSSPNSIKLLGKVKNKNLLILVVSGSTDSFLDTQTARRLGCELEYTNPSTFTVVGGGTMDSHAKCNGFQWEMGGHTFSADVWVLELAGGDMIIGVDILRTLGPVKLDCRQQTMTFKQDGKVIRLQWLPPEVSARMNNRRKLKTMPMKN